MQYTATRNNKEQVNSAFAIAKGLSKDGGLYLPTEIPALTKEELTALKNASYIERAEIVLGKFLTDFTNEELHNCCFNAYNGSFDDNNPAPVKALSDSLNVLELWHGPTCAFKDLALQILPHLLTTSTKKIGSDKETVILVATSGDTGKAALEGFKDVAGTKIIVFYPTDGVSKMQKRQMATQEGNNVMVCSIKGNFDDAQTGVKVIFGDKEFNQEINDNNKHLSSANSINWGRLAPQIVYYVSAYFDMGCPEKFNVVVPTGNFGNILAAYYAKQMGIPINKLICASNKNRVLTDFIKTGEYNKNREFFATESPSMDILISSNLERLLYLLNGNNDEEIVELQNKLFSVGEYKVSAKVLEKINENFVGGCCDDQETKNTIKETFSKYGYLIDTHTAVAFKVYEDYVAKTGDNTKTVIASTASPYKFAPSVLSALNAELCDDDFENLEKLSKLTNTQIPKSIKELKEKEIRFNGVIEKNEMKTAVADFLK